MKTTLRLTAAILCIWLLIALCGCTTEPAETVPTETTAPALSALELYSQSAANLQAAPNRILNYTISTVRTVGGQDFTETASGTASYSGIASDAMEALIQEKLTYGTVSADHTLTYCDGAAYSQISGCTFTQAMSAADFAASQLPALLLSSERYRNLTMQATEDGMVFTFSDPISLEAWVSGSDFAELVTASGTATLDTSGTLIGSTYRASYTYGPANYNLEISLRISAPATLDLSAVHPEHGGSTVALTCLEAPRMLLRAAGDIFTAQAMQCSISETVYSQAIPLTRKRQTEASISGVNESLAATLTNSIEVTDYRNQPTTTSQSYQFAGGICTSTVNGEPPIIQEGVTAQVMRTSIEDTILAGLFATGYLSGAELTTGDSSDTYCFTGSNAYAQALSANIGSFLHMDLSAGSATAVTGSLTIDRQTGLPTAMSISFSLTHTVSDESYQLTYQLDQALKLSPA